MKDIPLELENFVGEYSSQSGIGRTDKRCIYPLPYIRVQNCSFLSIMIPVRWELLKKITDYRTDNIIILYNCHSICNEAAES
jgi:hypothetical protein